MKVAYIFATSGHTASYKLGKMILPQLEEGRHGVEVVGMFFFDDDTRCSEAFVAVCRCRISRSSFTHIVHVCPGFSPHVGVNLGVKLLACHPW
jgi:hypothetical protein